MAKNLIERSFRRNVLFGYGAQGLKMVAGFAWMLILTKVVGIGVYGMVALLISLSGVLTNLLTFRTNEAVVRFYKRGDLEGSPGLCRLAIGAGLILDFGMAVLLFAVLQYFSVDIAIGLLKSPEVSNGVAAYSWVVLVTFLRGTGIGLLTATEKFRQIYSLTVIEQSLRLVILIVVLILDIGISLEIIVWVMFYPAFLVTAIILVNPLLEYFKTLGKAPIPEGEIRHYVRFSISTFTSSALKAGNRNIDTVILGYLTSPDLVGPYSLFRQFLSPLTIAVGPFYEQIYPRFVKAVSENDIEGISYTISTTNTMLSKWSMLLLVAITPVVGLYWWYMEFSFNNETVLTFFVMAATSLVVQRLWWTRGFALSYNPNISIVANVLSSILVISLVFALTWQVGLVGAALGVFGSFLAMAIFWRFALRRFCRNNLEPSI